MKLFDSHCHLQDQRIYPRAGELIERATAAGVGYMVCSGSAEDDWDQVAGLAATYPQVIPSFGLHPWYVSDRTSRWLDRLEGMLSLNPRAAVGEIGLDNAIEHTNGREQLDVFRQQLRLARTMSRPVTIHCRKAWGPLLDTLTTEITFPAGGIVHSWSGAPDLVQSIEALGLSVSFSGSITRDRNRRGRESAMVVSADRLLIETDSPDILPAGAHGDNEPANVALVAQSLAQIRGVSVGEVAELTTRNGLRLFAPAAAHAS